MHHWRCKHNVCNALSFSSFQIMKFAQQIVFTGMCITLSSCATYYSKTAQFNQFYESGEYSKSMAVAENTKVLTRKNNAVLGDLNYATAAFFEGDHQSSAERFDKADIYMEDYTTNVAKEALSYISNPNVTPYRPEHFEQVMLHFFQAMNYIALEEYDDAMVECRRMNLSLNKLSENFRRINGKHYAQDAFGHYVMGILYEALDNPNDAFIAYRNALNIYSSDYSSLFQTPVPKTLTKAVLRTAELCGFWQEATQYKELYGTESDYDPEQGRLIAFVLQGFAPMKLEKSFNFTRIGSEAGFFTFENPETGFTIPVDLGSSRKKNTNDNIASVRLTLPTFRERTPDSRCNLLINNTPIKAELVEDLNAIAPKSLQDRIWREVAKGIGRTITKQAINAAANEQDVWLGLIVQIINAITEKTDTRYWQSLPAQVKIVDIGLDEGEYDLEPDLSAERQTVTIRKGKTSFAVFRVVD